MNFVLLCTREGRRTTVERIIAGPLLAEEADRAAEAFQMNESRGAAVVMTGAVVNEIVRRIREQI